MFRKEVSSFINGNKQAAFPLYPDGYIIHVSFFSIALVILLFIWLLNAEYAKKQNVNGWIVYDSEPIRVYPIENVTGNISEIFVENGSYVKKGDILITIDSDASTKEVGVSESKIRSDILHSQLDILQAKKSHKIKLAEIKIDKLTKLIRLSEKKSGIISDSAVALTEVEDVQNNNLKRFTSLFNSNQISEAQYENVLLEQLIDKHFNAEKRIDNLNQTAGIENLPLELKEIQSSLDIDIADINLRISEIKYELSTILSSSMQVIVASIDGYISNIQVDTGSVVFNDKPLMIITPKDSKLEAKFTLPTKAIGNISIGQRIKIKVESFPYQKFGTLDGRVQYISENTFLNGEMYNNPIQHVEPVYLIKASIDSSLSSNNSTIYIKPGMLISGDIQIEERTLFKWVFDGFIRINDFLK